MANFTNSISALADKLLISLSDRSYLRMGIQGKIKQIHTIEVNNFSANPELIPQIVLKYMLSYI
jgi:hypothetical protein